MRLTKLFAAGLSLAMIAGMTSGAWAKKDNCPTCPVKPQNISCPTAPLRTVDPNFRGTVNVDIVDTQTDTFVDRIRTEVVDKVAPHVGQTRAAVEAMYGPSQEAMAPGKGYDIYTNEVDLAEGKIFKRVLSQDNLKVYEVTYNTTGQIETATDKVTDVKLRVIPRAGDHRNLVTKLLGDTQASMYRVDPQGEHVVYSIPRMRYIYYNDAIKDPFNAINMYFTDDGFLAGQEFITYRQPNQFVKSSACRYVEHNAKWQQDRKIGW